MQVELGEQAADFLGAPLERWQQPALDALAQPAHARTLERDRPVAQAEAPRFSKAVAIADRRIDGRAPLIPAAREQPVHFLLQHPL